MKNPYLFLENLTLSLRRGMNSGQTYSSLYIVQRQLAQWELEPTANLRRLISLAQKRLEKC